MPESAAVPGKRPTAASARPRSTADCNASSSEVTSALATTCTRSPVPASSATRAANATSTAPPAAMVNGAASTKARVAGSKVRPAIGVTLSSTSSCAETPRESACTRTSSSERFTRRVRTVTASPARSAPPSSSVSVVVCSSRMSARASRTGMRVSCSPATAGSASVRSASSVLSTVAWLTTTAPSSTTAWNENDTPSPASSRSRWKRSTMPSSSASSRSAASVAVAPSTLRLPGTKRVPSGTASATRSSRAGSVPAFSTLMTKSSVWPTRTGDGAPSLTATNELPPPTTTDVGSPVTNGVSGLSEAASGTPSARRIAWLSMRSPRGALGSTRTCVSTTTARPASRSPSARPATSGEAPATSATGAARSLVLPGR
ncbi:MAG: hypothetical protein A2138_19380 [Deltaproteobacteria bacterium RBG_16_71_12]|nr:MAG: hypothetical protein A2138_19380 [Deltaproteobacteria bacterium RBG_16_71_12]